MARGIAGYRIHEVTSSSDHAYADPLRRGAHFCAHHTARVVCKLSVGPTVKLTLAVSAR